MDIFKILDVPQKEPCEGCNPCMRIRLMEIGFIKDQEIKIKERMNGMYTIQTINKNGSVEQTIAVRKEELQRICFEKII